MNNIPLPQGSGGGGGGIEGLNATAAELNTLDESACGAIRKFLKGDIAHVLDADFHALFTLPASCYIGEVFLKITTPEATGTAQTVLIGAESGGSTAPASTAGLFEVSALGFVVNGGDTVWGYQLGSADFAELEGYLIVEIYEFA